MRMQLRSLLAAIALLLTASGLAQAIDITFDFSGLSDGPTATITSGAYSLSLFNPVNTGGTAGSFHFDSDGVYLGVGSVPFNAGFDMSVTGGPLQFKSYVIGWNNPSTAGTFSLLGGTGSSTGNPLDPVGTYTFAGTTIISPGDTVTLSGTITAGGGSALSQIKSITFSTVTVPEPSTYALGAIATGVMAAVTRRRKADKA